GRSEAGEGVLQLTLQPFPRFGLWHPKTGLTDQAGLSALHLLPEEEKNNSERDAQFLSPSGRGGSAEGRVGEGDAAPETQYIPILFYRAALEGAGTATLEALVAELESRGLAPVPIMVSSLKEAACID